MAMHLNIKRALALLNPIWIKLVIPKAFNSTGAAVNRRSPAPRNGNKTKQ